MEEIPKAVDSPLDEVVSIHLQRSLCLMPLFRKKSKL